MDWADASPVSDTFGMENLVSVSVKPADFWALTPAELRLMLGQTEVAAPLNRAGLDALLAAYPDHAKGTEDV